MSKLYLKPNPTLGDIQKYVKQLEEERGFTKETVADNCILLGEELGELFKTIRKNHTALKIDKRRNYDLDSASEIADIILVLTCIANRLDIDMEQALRDKEEENKKRTWSED